MARVTRRDVPRTPRPRATEPSEPVGGIEGPRSSGPAPRMDRDGDASAAARDEWLKAALEWKRFEAWCAANGLDSVPATRESLGVIAIYVTYLVANGRNAVAIARALMRGREPHD